MKLLRDALNLLRQIFPQAHILLPQRPHTHPPEFPAVCRLIRPIDQTFYIVIDYDKPVDEEGEQYETYFFSVVDEGDLLAAAEAAGVEQAVCSCPEKCAAGTVNTDCPVCSVNLAKCVGAEPEPEPAPEPEPEPEKPGNAGMILLVLAVMGIGGGAAWYFKIYRPKHQQADQPEEDDGGEYPGYDEFEDDGPPWDEEDETEEKEEIR